jgi:hypothetical protein
MTISSYPAGTPDTPANADSPAAEAKPATRLNRCADCRHGLPLRPRPGLDPTYRHCELRPMGLPVEAWIGVKCPWLPSKWEAKL